MNIDLQELLSAFQKWEQDYRVSPSSFLTEDEVAELEVDDVSSQRAIYFMQLLKEGKK